MPLSVSVIVSTGEESLILHMGRVLLGYEKQFKWGD
jgi:hypothetical protein